MVHYVFWLFSGGAPASQPGGGRGRGGFQSLPATQPRLGAAPMSQQILPPNEEFKCKYHCMKSCVSLNFAHCDLFS